jgi:thiol:disulfide interchange protein DsbC
VVAGSDVLYASADGRYVLQGDMYDVDRSENVTEQRLTNLRTGAIAELKAIGDDQAIMFGPKDAHYTVTVFTDVDCTFCRKLHSQIAEYNKLGIRVRYLFFPRSGPNTSSWTKAEAVWCSANRQEALTRAKLGETLADAPKCATPVARTYKLAKDLMLRGTPGIFSDKNEYISGYLSPEALLAHLKSREQPEAKPGSDSAPAEVVPGDKPVSDKANGATG